MAIIAYMVRNKSCYLGPSHSDTKSYQNLLVDVYGGEDGNYDGANLGNIPLLNTFSYMRTGRFLYTSGKIENAGAYGFYLESEANSDKKFESFVSKTDYLSPQNTHYAKGNGFSLRCLVR